MTVIEKIKLIREEHFFELDDWQKEFVSDLYSNAQDEEELTQRQINKVNEIYQDLGL